ncbi:hypothetical protein [Luteitalea sp. TBR-22]|uniref:hypothetical protein n=1 Tax=Luteitalea sp. TBR-22 TaxID=2802971 RepID=UPI001EF49183|nr:hypothetical protein [Luteitalea sp. TBR-22]
MRPTRAAAAPAWRYVLGGMLAAALAAAGNLAWRSAAPSYTGQPVPALIDPTSVALASVLSVLLAAGVYLLLSRGLTIATPLYVLGSLLTAAVSCVATFVPVMPDGTPTPPGFTHLTIPMHMWAGVMAAVVVPIVVLVGVRK